MKDFLKLSTLFVSAPQKIIEYRPNNNHWCKIVRDSETSTLMRSLNFNGVQALDISGFRWKDFGLAGYKNVLYPEFDICENALDRKFDLIVYERIFQHVSLELNNRINNISFLYGHNIYRL